MSYAHITNGVIDQIGQPPRLHHDGTRWWDLRDRDPAKLAALGWLPIIQAPRPADTDTTTSELTHALVDGQPAQVWTARPWTAEELAERAAAVNEETLHSRANTALNGLSTFLGITSPTNAQTLAVVRLLCRAVAALIRLQLRRLETTDGT